MCFGLESSPRLQYTLSKVNYSPTTWGLVSHLSTYKSPRMPHVSPGWGFPVTSALSLEKMSKSTEKVKKKYADTYKWTDDEVELLLTVTKEYKTKQIAKSIDWESCVDKYGEILEAYSAHYPSPEDAAAIGKDFPHKKDELTKSVLTSKLKAIRSKYRQAVDNKEATTLLYAMFVYNARREDWIQENDESVFENFRIRPSTRIRIRIG